MTKFNAKNERTKRRYLHYLKNAKGNGDAVVDGAMQAIYRLEVYTRFRDFDKFDTRRAIAFKDHLAKQTNARTKERLSQATLRSILAALKAFFRWLASQPGYRRLTYSDADYFNLSLHDEAIATARREKSPPTIEQIRHVVNTMPSRTDIERRDRAVVAFIILTGLRDNAVASLRLGDVDLAKGKVRQDARHVRTKFAQTNEVWFFQIGDDFRADRKRERRLSDDEYVQLGVALREAERTIWPAAVAAARFIAFTGFRRGEVLALRWAEVDLARRTATLADSKTGRSVRPLSRATCEALRGLIRTSRQHGAPVKWQASRSCGRASSNLAGYPPI